MVRPGHSEMRPRRTSMTKTTIRALLGAVALAFVALSFSTHSMADKAASGGTNGASLDGVDEADQQPPMDGVSIAASGGGGTGGPNGTSLDGIGNEIADPMLQADPPDPDRWKR